MQGRLPRRQMLRRLRTRRTPLRLSAEPLAARGRCVVTLDEARANIGAGVVYRRPYCPAEDGVITGVSSTSVFVRYCDQHPGADGKATAPEDLTLLRGGA